MTLDKNILFNLVLAAMFFVTVPALAALHEARLDVYVSMFTLEYFVALAALRPRRRVRDFLAVALIVAFAAIVAFRVAEVLL